MKESQNNRDQLSENGKTRIDRLRWDDVRVFLAIARAGTLSGAAIETGSGLATVSRQIERLEFALGLTLFSRHQNGYRLTDDGEALMQRAEALEQAAMAFTDGSAAQMAMTGKVRLATAETFASHMIIPALPQFLAQYPGLTLEIVTDVQIANLHRRDADLALRMVKPERGNVKIRRIGTLGFGLYGAKSYVNNREASPRYTSDRFITWSETYSHLPAAQWIERSFRGHSPALVTTTLSAQLAGAVAGIGLAVLPHFLGRQHDLICLQDNLGIDQDIWLVIHSDLAQSRRVRVVSEFLVELIRQNGL